MADFKTSFWKIFEVLGFLGTWATESLKPDEDGKIRITQAESNALVEGICKVFGWSVDIEL